SAVAIVEVEARLSRRHYGREIQLADRQRCGSPHSHCGSVCALDCHGRGFDGTSGKDLAAATLYLTTRHKPRRQVATRNPAYSPGGVWRFEGVLRQVDRAGDLNHAPEKPTPTASRETVGVAVSSEIFVTTMRAWCPLRAGGRPCRAARADNTTWRDAHAPNAALRSCR